MGKWINTRNFGPGEFIDGETRYYTTDRGEILTPGWCQNEVVKRLGRFKGNVLDRRIAAWWVTAPERRNSRCTIGALVREADNLMVSHGFAETATQYFRKGGTTILRG